jgi:hypothetical protein
MPWILSAAFLVVEALAVASAVHALFTARMFESDFAESAQVRRDDYEFRPLYFKAGAQAARLLAPIL